MAGKAGGDPPRAAGAVAGARASGGEDGDGNALTARNERAAQPASGLTQFGTASIAGVEVLVPVLVLLGAGLLSLAAGVAVALRRRHRTDEAP